MLNNSIHQEMLTSPGRYIEAKVELYSGSTLVDTFAGSDSILEFTVSKAGAKKFFGFGVCQELKLKLLDPDRSIEITKGQSLLVRFGVESNYVQSTPRFFVEEVSRDENSNNLIIKAVDMIYRSKAHTYSELEMTTPYTITELLERIGSFLGITITGIGSSEFSTSYPNGANFGGDETLRSVLDSIAEVTQRIYYAYQDAIVFRVVPKGEPALTINRADYFTATGKPTLVLNKIVHTTELGDNIEAHIDGEGVTQYIRDNPFWNIRDDIDTLITDAISRIGGLSNSPFTCNWRGNYLLIPGDRIAIITKDGNRILSNYVEDSFTYNGGLISNMSWEYSENPETEATPATLGDALRQTYAKVDKIERNITLYVGEVVESVLPVKIDEHLEGINTDVEDLKATQATTTSKIATLEMDNDNISQRVSEVEDETTTITNRLGEVQQTITEHESSIGDLTVAADNISASVERVQQSTTTSLQGMNDEIASLSQKVEATMTETDVKIVVMETVENSIDKVTTSTGFTFDDEGLHIQKSTSEIESLLDEEGLLVSRQSVPILTAKAEGVNALNVTVRQYLNVGGSRFERYGDRTGCFWMGD